jgi:hypothetical protein
VETITLKCLEKEPRLRFQSARALADELRRFLDHRPIVTRPIGPAGHVRRWCRRKPIVAGLSALVAALLMVVGVLAVLHHFISKDDEYHQLVAGQADEERRRQEALAQDADRRRLEKEALAETAKEKARLADEERQRQEVLALKEKQERKIQEARARKEEAQRADLTYLEDMRRAAKFIQTGEFSQAVPLLQNYPQAPPQPDRRGWEWHLLVALCREAGFAVGGQANSVPALAQEAGLSKRGHASQVLAVAWTTDGARLASGDGQGMFKI